MTTLQVILSAPATDQSGTGSLSVPIASPLLAPCEFNSCPASFSGIGFDPSNRECIYIPERNEIEQRTLTPSAFELLQCFPVSVPLHSCQAYKQPRASELMLFATAFRRFRLSSLGLSLISLSAAPMSAVCW